MWPWIQLQRRARPRGSRLQASPHAPATSIRSSAGESAAPPPPAKSEKEMSAEIAAIIRQARLASCLHLLRRHRAHVLTSTIGAQITASVTFLPLLDEPCAPKASRCSAATHASAFCAQAHLTCWSTQTRPQRCRPSGRRATRGWCRARSQCACAPSPRGCTRWRLAWHTRRMTRARSSRAITHTYRET